MKITKKWRTLNLLCTENIDELIQADPEKASVLPAKIEFPSEPIRNGPNGTLQYRRKVAVSEIHLEFWGGQLF